jgi:hypothetical protein
MLERVALRILATIHLTKRSLKPLMRAMLCIRTLTYVAARTLSLHSPLSVLLLAHIVKYNSAIHKSLKVGVGVSR